jgi:hypothetical protein
MWYHHRKPGDPHRRCISGPQDIVLLVRLGIWLMLLPGLLKALPLRSLLRLLTPRSGRANPCREQAEQRRRYTDALLRRLPYTNRCLLRTLVLFRLLRQAGWSVQFCVGIRYDTALPATGPIQGHAWLRYRGAVFLEPGGGAPIAGYRQTFCYPADPPAGGSP